MPQDLLPDPDPGPDDAEPDGFAPDEDAPGPEQGLYVTLPAEHLTLAGFCQGGASDTMAPGALLATVVDTELKRDITTAEGECRSFSAQLSSENISARIAARAAFTEWSAELTNLHAKREQMEKDLAPLVQARDEAKDKLYWASKDREQLELNFSDPAYAYIGHGTKTSAFFQWGNFGFFVRVLLSGDKGFIWDEAFSFMDYLCERSGYRTEGRDLPSEADHYRKHWQEIYDRANPPAPVSHDVREIAQSGIVGELTRARVREESARQDAAAAADWRGDRETEIRRRVQVTPDPAKEYQRLSSVRT